MKWTYSIRHKITAATLMAVVLGLILLNNLVERRHFKQLEESFSSMYNDRLLAESYLFQLYDNLQKKQELLEKVNTAGLTGSHKAGLNYLTSNRKAIISKYEETYLTKEEAVEFDNLKKMLEDIDELDKSLLQSDDQQQLSGFISKNEEVSSHIFNTLSALSNIQTSEGESIKNKSEKIFLGSISTSHLEMAIIIVIAIIIQALIFSSKTLRTQSKQNPSLN